MKVFQQPHLFLASWIAAAALTSACGPAQPAKTQDTPSEAATAEPEKEKLEPLATPEDFASWKPATPADPKSPIAITLPESHEFRVREDKDGLGGFTVTAHAANGVNFEVEVYPTKATTMEEVKKEGYAKNILREEEGFVIFNTQSGPSTHFRVLHKEGDTFYVCKSRTPKSTKGLALPEIAACRSLGAASTAAAPANTGTAK